MQDSPRYRQCRPAAVRIAGGALAMALGVLLMAPLAGCETMVNAADSFNEGSRNTVRSNTPDREYKDEKGRAAQEAIDDGEG